MSHTHCAGGQCQSLWGAESRETQPWAAESCDTQPSVSGATPALLRAQDRWAQRATLREIGGSGDAGAGAHWHLASLSENVTASPLKPLLQSWCQRREPLTRARVALLSWGSAMA